MGAIFNGQLSNEGAGYTIDVQIQLIQFIEDNINFVYSPHLDVSGYGNTEKEAQDSFEIQLQEFLDYSVKKNTIKKVLTNLGWNVGKSKKIKNPKPPSYSELVKNSEYLSSILDNNSFSSTQRNIAIPA